MLSLLACLQHSPVPAKRTAFAFCEAQCSQLVQSKQCTYSVPVLASRSPGTNAVHTHSSAELCCSVWRQVKPVSLRLQVVLAI